MPRRLIRPPKFWIRCFEVLPLRHFKKAADKCKIRS
jgi:hypothetical protein